MKIKLTSSGGGTKVLDVITDLHGHFLHFKWPLAAPCFVDLLNGRVYYNDKTRRVIPQWTVDPDDLGSLRRECGYRE